MWPKKISYSASQRERVQLKYRSEEIWKLCIAAASSRGASPEAATSLADATIHALEAGKPALGIRHFFDYLNAMEEERLDGAAGPSITRPASAVYVADAGG